MDLTNQFIDRIVYDAGGHTGKTYYVRFVRRSDGYIWDNVAAAMASNPTWENSVILLVETGETGAFPVVIPATLPPAYYDVIVYEQSGFSPGNTDDVEAQWSRSRGSIFGF
jgi:hypothetical protein